MNKVLLTSDEQYFEYCVGESIGSIYRKYSSQSCYIDDGEECDHWEYVFGESMHITVKPKNYPCIFTWHCDEGDHDYYYGTFVYQEDF